jgi:mannose-6-phosphate isomerase-like protein (cupin superfamily)
MDAFAAEELLAELKPGQHDFAEFFRSSTLSLTVARWPAGSADDQQLHTEDEVCYVVSGRARLSVADEDVEVGAGSIAYVVAGVEDHLHDSLRTCG